MIKSHYVINLLRMSQQHDDFEAFPYVSMEKEWRRHRENETRIDGVLITIYISFQIATIYTHSNFLVTFFEYITFW